jgi:hypothetical protein
MTVEKRWIGKGILALGMVLLVLTISMGAWAITPTISAEKGDSDNPPIPKGTSTLLGSAYSLGIGSTCQDAQDAAKEAAEDACLDGLKEWCEREGGTVSNEQITSSNGGACAKLGNEYTSAGTALCSITCKKR